MKKLFFSIILLFFTNSCSNNKVIIRSDFNKIFEEHGVVGNILVFDTKAETHYLNNSKIVKHGYLPASTFKIPNSLIAIELGITEPDTVFKWNGGKRIFNKCEKDMTFSEAMKLSCTPIYQDVARKIGVENFNNYLKKFNYGKMYITKINIDHFWLQGDSKISQYEQLSFIKNLYYKNLPLKNETMEKVKKMIIIRDDKDNKLSGKTGFFINNNEAIGWFVGYLEKNDNVLFFVTLIKAKDFEFDNFVNSRIEITEKILELF